MQIQVFLLIFLLTARDQQQAEGEDGWSQVSRRR